MIVVMFLQHRYFVPMFRESFKVIYPERRSNAHSVLHCGLGFMLVQECIAVFYVLIMLLQVRIMAV